MIGPGMLNKICSKKATQEAEFKFCSGGRSRKYIHGFLPDGRVHTAAIAVIFSWVRALRLMTGVCPIGAQVLRTSGLIISPLSSSKTITARLLRAFFNKLPVVFNPSFDCFLVTLDSSGCGLLRAKTKAGQDPPNVINMIANAEFFLDKISDPRAVPKIGVESVGSRPLHQ